MRLLAGSEIRQRWRSTVAIALLVGVVGASSTTSPAGSPTWPIASTSVSVTRCTSGSTTQHQIDRAFSGGNPGPPVEPDISFHIVGIDRRPLDLGVRSFAGGVVILTPAFAKKWDGKIGQFTDVLRVKTTAGPADVPRVSAAARRIFGKAEVFGTQSLGVERAARAHHRGGWRDPFRSTLCVRARYARVPADVDDRRAGRRGGLRPTATNGLRMARR